jgi:AcrR family transcriptional regulator
LSPRSASVNEELRARSRRRILDAALTLFAERGYSGTSISEIAARAEVARGLVSYYFKSKENLLETLLTEALTAMYAMTAPAPGETTPDSRLAGMIDRTLQAAAATIDLQRLVLSLMLQPATRKVYARVEATHEPALRAAEDQIRQTFRDRGAEDPALEEATLRSVLEGVIFKLTVYPETFPLEAVRARIFQMYDLPVKTSLLDAPPLRPGRLRTPL